MGGGAASQLQDYLVPPANRTTRNFLPRLYSKPDMVKEIWKYLHKPLYINVGQLDGHGRTAAQVATAHGKDDVAALLQHSGSQPLGGTERRRTQHATTLCKNNARLLSLSFSHSHTLLQV